jgi:integrase
VNKINFFASHSEAQMSDFLTAIQGHRFEVLYMFMLFTGVRQSEALGLKWEDFDFAAGTVTISRQFQRLTGKHIFSTPKNDKTRSIPLTPSTITMMREYKRTQAQWRLLAGPAWEDSGLVFTNEVGGPLSHVTTYKDCKRIMTSIGLPDFKLHDLRHSYAVNAIRSGMDIKSIQESMGHFSSAFTMDIYMTVTGDMMKESAAKMEAFYQRIKNP